jgi:hypothetical protein
MRYRLLLGIALFGLVLFLSFRAVGLLRPRDPITPENFARIKVGMTEGQVRAILGGQEGVPPPCGSGQPPGTYTLSWYGDEGTIWVLFQVRAVFVGIPLPGTVLRASYGPPNLPEAPSPFVTWRAWLGW